MFFSVFLVRISKFFIIILISTHGVACILYLLACQAPEKCGADTWMTDLGMSFVMSFLMYIYLSAMYYIVFMANKTNTTMDLAVRYCNSTSTGYGDLYAHTDYEKGRFDSVASIL